MDDAKSILNHGLIAGRYFFPRMGTPPSARFVEVDGARLACFHAAPHAEALTLLHFHGNGEIVADYVPDHVEAWTKMGVNVFLAEYRGYGGSTGEPRLGQLLDDVIKIVEATGVDPSRLVVYGRSVGSIFAVEAAACFPSIAGLVIESGIASPLERILMRVSPSEMGVEMEDLEAAARSRLDHRAKLAAAACPVLVMHALHDSVVDVTHAEQNHLWSGARSELVLFPRGDHNSMISVNFREWLAALESFLALAAEA